MRKESVQLSSSTSLWSLPVLESWEGFAYTQQHTVMRIYCNIACRCWLLLLWLIWLKVEFQSSSPGSQTEVGEQSEHRIHLIDALELLITFEPIWDCLLRSCFQHREWSLNLCEDKFRPSLVSTWMNPNLCSPLQRNSVRMWWHPFVFVSYNSSIIIITIPYFKMILLPTVISEVTQSTCQHSVCPH